MAKGGTFFRQQTVPELQTSVPQGIGGVSVPASRGGGGVNMHLWDGAPPQHPTSDPEKPRATIHVMRRECDNPIILFRFPILKSEDADPFSREGLRVE